jgi:hypothetical protein
MRKLLMHAELRSRKRRKVYRVCVITEDATMTLKMDGLWVGIPLRSRGELICMRSSQIIR